MTADLNTDLLPGELAQIVVSVLETMTGLSVREGGAPWFANPDRLTSAVHLTGDWTGTIVLECERSLACRLASRFLSAPFTEVDDVVRDVMGELANMVGGNVKCVLAGGIRLSMPCVVDGSNYRIRIPGTEVRLRLAFDSEEGTFWVTVLGVDPIRS